MSSLREEIVSEIKHCDKVIQDAAAEMAGLMAQQKSYRDRKTMLIRLLFLYDKENPDERKESENDA